MRSAPAPAATRRVRVVLVSPPLDSSGGIGRLMSYVMDDLDAERIAVRHVDTRGPSTRPIFSIGPMVLAIFTLLVLKARRQVDVVHINMSYRGSTIRKCTIATLCRWMSVPTVLHLHTCEYEDFFRRLPGVLKRAVRSVFQRASHVIVLGRVWERFVVDALRVPEDHVTVLYNGAPGPRPLEAPTGRDGGDTRLLFLGRLGDRKGAPELLRALAGLPADVRWSLTMAGDGEIEEARNAAQALGILDRLAFTGWLDPEQVAKLLGSSDVLVLPSHAEGLPMAIIEAFAHGVAVIATPVGAIPEIVLDGESGLLVPVGDVDALSGAVGALCVDPEMRRKLAGAGRALWEASLDIADYTVRLSNIWLHFSAPLTMSGNPVE